LIFAIIIANTIIKKINAFIVESKKNKENKKIIIKKKNMQSSLALNK